MLNNLKEVFFPPGAAEYKVDFSRENSRSLCVLLAAGMIVSGLIFLSEYFWKIFPIEYAPALEYLLFFAISAAVFVANLKEIYKNGTFLLYLWSGFLLIWSILLCAGDKREWPTFIFMFFILVLPLLIRDVWGNIVAFTVVFSLIFAVMDLTMRPLDLARFDISHLFICAGSAIYLSKRVVEDRLHMLQKNTVAEEEADRDGLTGIYNRRGGEQLIRAYVKNGMPGTFLLVDVDDFKHINDNYGHAAGDVALKNVADCLKHCFRETDVVMRMGGDEFIVYAVGMADARHVEEKLAYLKSKLHQIYLDETKKDHVTASIGCVINLGSYPNYEELSSAADRLLYKVKVAGKDNYMSSDVDYKPQAASGKDAASANEGKQEENKKE